MQNNCTSWLLLFPVFSFTIPCQALVSEPLDKLLSAGKITASFESKGGYQEGCMQVVVKNNTADSVVGFIEPGRRLNSINDQEQDILVVKAAVFRLKAHESDTVTITGFCCESTKSAPSRGSRFSAGVLAPAGWLILANLINLHPFSKDAIQHAIWVLSDKHDIRSIPAYRNPAMDQLRHAVADILDIELPWYSFRFKSDSTDLFTGTKTHFFAEVPFEIPFRAVITPQIFNLHGDLIYQGDPTYFSAGEHIIAIEAPVETWPVTDYELFLMEDFHTQNKKLRFTLEDE